MSSVRIRPGPAYGRVRAPPSKSYTHRALVVGHLGRRTFRVRNPLDSDDTRATSSAVSRLGTPVHRTSEVWRVDSPSARLRQTSTALDCHESGTTLRFACALAALADRAVVIGGSERLSHRPVDELLEALTALGARCRHLVRHGLPIEVRGPIHGGRVSLDASRSSQFASALLFVLPTLEENSSLELRGPIVSQPYLIATLATLAHHGIRVDGRGRRLEVPGRQHYRGAEFQVPGDASSAAYLWAAAAVSGGCVEVHGIPREWPQADLAVLDLLRRNGATVSRRADGAMVSAGAREPFRVDLTGAPDLYPLVGVLAATTRGESRIEGAEHVVFKESNRQAATALLARHLGSKVDVMAGGLRIRGTDRPRALNLEDLTDHRVVMSAAVGALAADRESRVGERRAVRKSFPGFWATLATLSGAVRHP